MTWDELMAKIREGLTESGARLRVLGDLLVGRCDNGGLLDYEQTNVVVVHLCLAVSDLHAVIEHLAIALDAVVGAYRENDESQEVKRD